MNALSLYSGIGGIDLAAHWSGIQTVAFCEIDPFCRRVLSRHWPAIPILEKDTDVTSESLQRLGVESVDFIFGGPPCQPFSVAGKREGTDDPRHRWPEMARIIDELRPAYVAVENVAGFSDVAEQLVRADLDSLGYRTVRFDLPAAGVGAPHRRERIFVVAYADLERRDGVGRGRILDSEWATQRNDADGCGGVGNSPASAGMADAEFRTRGARPRNSDDEARQRKSEWGGSGLAHTDRSGRGERCGAESIRAELGAAECGGDTTVGYADNGGRQERWPGGTRGLRSTQDDRDGATNNNAAVAKPDGQHASRGAQSRLGRALDVATRRLDAARWPAAYGCEQFTYEPPRVTTVREYRRKRLKALGNAVVPLQVLPILAAIYELWRVESLEGKA